LYFPYFRGKQYELIAIRESADAMATASFVPIIEPVRESLTSLRKALLSVEAAAGEAILLLNPRYGDHRDESALLLELYQQHFSETDAVTPAILLTSETDVGLAAGLLRAAVGRDGAVVHAGYPDARRASAAFSDLAPRMTHIFIDEQASTLYRRHFRDARRVLVRDGFERKRNADYSEIDTFSDLHITYPEFGLDGYGDFLTVGDTYSEGGGPAYAVAIHLTYIDPEQDDAMFAYHFISDTNDTPTDPAGKFGQALAKLMFRLNRGDSHLEETSAIREFRELHDRGHFPGLGYVKKLSIKHHLETLSLYHGRPEV